MEVAEVIPGRTNEQCRDRWTDKLNRTVKKGRWTNEEDNSLLQSVQDIGISNWEVVSERLNNGRTYNDVSPSICSFI